MWSEDSQEGSGVQPNCMHCKLKASWKRSKGLPFLPLVPAQQVEFPRALRGSRAAWQGHHPCSAFCLTLAAWLQTLLSLKYFSCSRWPVRTSWFLLVCFYFLFLLLLAKNFVFFFVINWDPFTALGGEWQGEFSVASRQGNETISIHITTPVLEKIH